MKISIFTLAATAGLLLTGAALADTEQYQRVQQLTKDIGAIAAIARQDGGDWRKIYASADAIDTRLTVSEQPVRMSAAPANGLAHPATASVETVDADFVMAQFRTQMGSNFHLQLRRALPSEDVSALFIRGGKLTLPELAASAPPGTFTVDGQTFQARRPIVVWSDAELLIQPGERLLLDDAAGAFVFNAGLLRLEGASIEGTGSENVRQKDFHPFVVTALAGAMQAKDSRFTGLGFADYAPMQGVSIVGGALFPSKLISYVTGSEFDNAGTLSVRNSNGVTVSGNRFRRMRGPAVQLLNASRATVIRNVIVDTANAQGISLKGGTTHATIRGNIVIGGKAGGILVANGSSNIRIEANLVSANRQSGISLTRSACVSIGDNIISNNQKGGIVIRQSARSRVEANRLVANSGAGLSVVQQPSGGGVTVVGNEFLFNRSGLFGASADEIVLERNDFSGQRPVILDGEFAAQMPRLLMGNASAKVVSLTLAAGNANASRQLPAIPLRALQDCVPGGEG